MSLSPKSNSSYDSSEPNHNTIKKMSAFSMESILGNAASGIKDEVKRSASPIIEVDDERADQVSPAASPVSSSRSSESSPSPPLNLCATTSPSQPPLNLAAYAQALAASNLFQRMASIQAATNPLQGNKSIAVSIRNFVFIDLFCFYRRHFTATPRPATNTWPAAHGFPANSLIKFAPDRPRFPVISSPITSEMSLEKTQGWQKTEDTIHLSAIDVFGEQVQREAVSQHCWTGGVLSTAEVDRDTSENLVPEPASKIEAVAGSGNRQDPTCIEPGGGPGGPLWNNSPKPASRDAESSAAMIFLPQFAVNIILLT